MTRTMSSCGRGRRDLCRSRHRAGAGEEKSAKITGFLMGNMCAASRGTDQDAKQHDTSCALMPACEKSGYAVVPRDKVYKLDENGNKMAAAFLRKTKTRQGVAGHGRGHAHGRYA